MGVNMKKRFLKNKIDIYAIVILLCVFIGLVLVLTRCFTYAYGSTIDWTNQHYAFPEYFRQLFYDTKNPFPSFATQLGGGQNIYNFSYYGLFSPVFLFSYALPFVSMSTYLQAISILSVMFTIVLFYVWIRRRYETRVSFFATFLLLCSAPLIFHSHRHIMFVVYMPILIIALMCCDKFFENKSRKGLVFCLFLILLTSYYFAIGAYLAIAVYIVSLYLAKSDYHIDVKNMLKRLLNLALCMLLAGLMAAILWIPTILALIHGRAKTNVALHFSEILMPNMDYMTILYSPYSIGLTAILLVAIGFSFVRKKRGFRFLGICLLSFTIFKVVIFVMNGFMYGDSKALIPFLPLSVLLVAELANGLMKEKTKTRHWIIINVVIVLCLCWFIAVSDWVMLLVFFGDALLLNFGYFLYYKFGYKKAFFIIQMVFVLAVCVIINVNDGYEKMDKLKQADITTKEKIEKSSFLEDDNNIVRITNLYDKYNNVNMNFEKNSYISTVYSSIQNQAYNKFYYHEFQNEVAYRNSALVTEVNNSLFYSYMGKKYLIQKENSEFSPKGFKQIDKIDDLIIMKNDNVLPIGYARNSVMSEKQYKTLKYPYNIKALLGNTIVDDDSIDEKNVSGIKKIDLTDKIFNNLPKGITYNKKSNLLMVRTAEKEKSESGILSYIKKADKSNTCEMKVKLEESIDNYLVITCDVNNNFGQKSSDVYTKINGVKNKLTIPTWKYYNNNKKYAYIISSEEPIKELDFVFSNGLYNMKNWKFYEIDADSILNDITQDVDEFMFNKEKTNGDEIFGTINVTNNNSVFKLTVPFDKGFEILVDGKKTDYECVDTAFIGFDISKGEHEIEITYTAPGRNIALVISGVCWLIFAVLCVTEVVNKRKMKIEK